MAKGCYYNLPRIMVLLCLLCVCSVSKSQALNAQSEGPLSNGKTAVEDFATVGLGEKNDEILAVYGDLFAASYEKAPDIQIARKERQQKQQESYTAKARRFAPAVDGRVAQVHELNYEENPTSPDNTESTYSDGRDYTDWGLSLELPLFNMSKSVALGVAQTEKKQADNNLQITTQELDLGLRELLGNYLTSTYRLFNIRNSVRLSSEHVAKIHRGYELRDQTKLQLLRAQANLTDLETRQDLDEQAQEAAYRKLLDFTGLDESHPGLMALELLLQDEKSIAGCINSLAAVEENYPVIRDFMESMASPELMQYFQENSLLYEQIKVTRNLANERARTFTQSEWFEVAVIGQYDRRDDSRFEEYDGEGSISLVFSVPLFTGGTIFSTTKSQAMAKHVAAIKKKNDMRVQFHAIENTKKLIDALQNVRLKQQLNLEQQKEIVVLSFKSYQIKQTSMQDLLTSQNRLIDAKNVLMETTNRLGTLYHRFAWELGQPFPLPETKITM